jgi:hypothetical protein
MNGLRLWDLREEFRAGRKGKGAIIRAIAASTSRVSNSWRRCAPKGRPDHHRA